MVQPVMTHRTAKPARPARPLPSQHSLPSPDPSRPERPPDGMVTPQDDHRFTPSQSGDSQHWHHQSQSPSLPPPVSSPAAWRVPLASQWTQLAAARRVGGESLFTINESQITATGLQQSPEYFVASPSPRAEPFPPPSPALQFPSFNSPLGPLRAPQISTLAQHQPAALEPTSYVSAHAYLANLNRNCAAGGVPLALLRPRDSALSPDEAQAICSVAGCPWVVDIRRGEEGRWREREGVRLPQHDHWALADHLQVDQSIAENQVPASGILVAHRDVSGNPDEDSDEDMEEDSGSNSVGGHLAGNLAYDDPAWSLPLEGKAIRALVENRHDIFAKQRRFSDASRQQRSEKLAKISHKSYTISLNARYSAVGYQLERYKTFCADMKIPPYPITPDLALLCVLRDSLDSKAGPGKRMGCLNILRKATMEVWKGVDGAEASLGDELISAHQAYRESNAQYPSGAKYAVVSSSPAPNAPARSAPNDRNGTALGLQAAPSSQVSSSSPSPSLRLVSLPSSPESNSERHITISRSPKVGDRFADEHDAIARWWQHVVPVLGVGVRIYSSSAHRRTLACNRVERVKGRTPCAYRIVLVEADNGDGWVVDRASHLEHNHGPTAQILANPTWRPRRTTVENQKRLKATERTSSRTQSEAAAASQKRSAASTASSATPHRPRKRAAASKTSDRASKRLKLDAPASSPSFTWLSSFSWLPSLASLGSFFSFGGRARPHTPSRRCDGSVEDENEEEDD